MAKSRVKQIMQSYEGSADDEEADKAGAMKMLKAKKVKKGKKGKNPFTKKAVK